MRDYPCDFGECPYGAHSGYDCHDFCGLSADENEYDEMEVNEDDYY